MLNLPFDRLTTKTTYVKILISQKLHMFYLRLIGNSFNEND